MKSLDGSTPANQTTINFQTAGSPANFYETHRTVNQGASTTLVQTDICYDSTVQPNCSNTAITLPLTEIKRYTILSNGQQSLNDTLISGSLPTEIDEYDFGVSPHGALLRKILVTYASLGNNIGALPATITVQDGGGTQKEGSGSWPGISGSLFFEVVGQGAAGIRRKKDDALTFALALHPGNAGFASGAQRAVSIFGLRLVILPKIS